MTRILVVDDDRPQAEEFGVLLRNAGCDVTLAGNGREAMDLLRHDVPDVVLTDLDMPEMDGLELVQAIRREYPALPVILMTAMGSEDVAAKALHHGAASYVRKRSLAREVVRTVGSVLAVARALPQQERVLDCLTEDQLGFVLGTGEERWLETERFFYFYRHLRDTFLQFQETYDAASQPDPAL